MNRDDHDRALLVLGNFSHGHGAFEGQTGNSQRLGICGRKRLHFEKLDILRFEYHIVTRTTALRKECQHEGYQLSHAFHNDDVDEFSDDPEEALEDEEFAP
jgi:hypothetical protein